MKQVEIGKTYKTNKGEDVKIVKEIRQGYFLGKRCDDSGCQFFMFDRKGVSAMYVNLFLML